MQPDLFSEVRSKGYKCSCCGQFVKVYRRRLSGSMAAVLLLMYRHGKFDWLHVENWLKVIGRPSLRADFHKLVHWTLLEKKKENREDGSNRNGYYKITGRGIAFIIGEFTVKESVLIYNNTVEGFEGKDVTILDCLGKKFRYDELMSN